MAKAGDVVIVDFSRATGIKRRPAVVLSSDAYHKDHADVILGVLTSNMKAAVSSGDHSLQDWKAAGLRVPTAYRTYFGMALSSAIRKIGRLSDRDWKAVQECLKKSLGST